MRKIARAVDNRAGHVDRSLTTSSLGLDRSGFVVKELLVVLAVVGIVWAPLKLLDSWANDDRKSGTCDRRSLMEYEVPLGNEFVCLVSVVSYQNPVSQTRPYYLSRLQFARRESSIDRGFLFEVLTEETDRWRNLTRASIDSLIASEAVLQARNECLVARRMGPDRCGKPQRVANVPPSLRTITAVNELADPLWRCVPPDMQEGGFLNVASATDLDHLHDLDDFPLDRLAAAIRTRAVHDGWQSVDPQDLLPRQPVMQLTSDQQRTLARSLVLRLAAELSAAP